MLIALGTRLGDTPTQNYQLPRLPNPDAPIIHIAEDAQVIGRVFPTHLGIVSQPADFCHALAKHTPQKLESRAGWVKEIKDFMQQFRSYTPKTPGDGMDFSHVVGALSAQLGDEIILTMDQGTFHPGCIYYGPLAGANRCWQP